MSTNPNHNFKSMIIFLLLGMIHVGMGPTHLINFLGQCNIPPLSEPSIRKYEAKVGKTITDVALDSCRAAQAEEKQMSDTVRRINLNRTKKKK